MAKKMMAKGLSLFLAFVMLFSLNFGITAEAAICPTCGGTGRSGICYVCGGTGQTSQTIWGSDPVTGTPVPQTYYYPCSACGGSGQNYCPQCHGSGQVADNIPVDSGDTDTDPDDGGDGDTTIGEPIDFRGAYEYIAGVAEYEDGPCLLDNNNETKYNVMSTSYYICWEAPKMIAVSSYVLTTANDTATFTGRNPKSWVLYGSNKKLKGDSKKWIKIHAVTDDTTMKAKNFTSYTFKLKKRAKAYKYYKLQVLDNHGDDCTQLAGLTLKGKTFISRKTAITSAKKKGTTSIAVAWKKPKGVKGYQLQYSTSAKFKNSKKITVKKATTTKKTIKNLKKGKKYYVRIRTYKVVNGVKIYSKWSKKNVVKL